VVSELSFSRRVLRDLGVSAVNNGFKYIHRRDAENAEEAQRISNQETTRFECRLQGAVDSEDSG
jgi:hypothetical protein